MCGVSLQTGQKYLLPIRPGGRTRLVLCSANILKSSITREQKKFLRSLC